MFFVLELRVRVCNSYYCFILILASLLVCLCLDGDGEELIVF